jgi:hypothetical protein
VAGRQCVPRRQPFQSQLPRAAVAKGHCARVVGGGPLGLFGFLGGLYDALNVQLQRCGALTLHTHPFERSQFFCMAWQCVPSQSPLHEHWREKTLHLKSKPPVGEEPVVGAACAAAINAMKASKAIPRERIFVRSLGAPFTHGGRLSCKRRGIGV